MAGNDSLNASVIHGGVRYLSSALRATLSPIFASLSQRGWLLGCRPHSGKCGLFALCLYLGLSCMLCSIRGVL